MDNRNSELALIIVNQALAIKTGMTVTIDVTGVFPEELVQYIVKAINDVGAYPQTKYTNMTVLKEIIIGASKSSLESLRKVEMTRLKSTDAYIMIKSILNQEELSDVSEEQMKQYNEFYLKDVNAYIVNKTKWLSIRYPNESMAQNVGMSVDAFDKFYFDVCTLDYRKLEPAMIHLKNLMLQTDQVRITGLETDVTFSIKNIPAHECAGYINLPDGEVYTAPVRNSINGKVKFNVPTVYQGEAFKNITLEFVDGKITDATSDNNEEANIKLNKILNTDEGSRYIGEFALGVNPAITHPINDILFDEKIGGSFHLTPGFCYDNASNGNESGIHWDLICIQTPEYGGGEIYFDNILIRKDGDFLIPELLPLNIK